MCYNVNRRLMEMVYVNITVTNYKVQGKVCDVRVVSR